MGSIKTTMARLRTKPRGVLSLIFNAYAYAVEPVAPRSYRNRCPDCGLDFIGTGRWEAALQYLEHYKLVCPGNPNRDPKADPAA